MNPRHEPDVQRAPAGKDLDVVALAAEQDQRGSVAGPHYGLALLRERVSDIVHAVTFSAKAANLLDGEAPPAMLTSLP